MEHRMAQRSPLIRERMRTPRAAAIAGMLFSLLLTTILVLLRISVQAASQEARAWLAGNADTVVLALNLVPFGGIAFLWFIGVVRDRQGLFLPRPVVLTGLPLGRGREGGPAMTSNSSASPWRCHFLNLTQMQAGHEDSYR